MKRQRKLNWRNLLAGILLVSLVFSIFYALANIVTAPSESVASEPHAKLKSDYVLMLLQCILACIITFLPSMIQRKWKIDIPNFMYILYFIFLYCAVYLGEVQNFYYLIPNWDIMLHTFSGAMLGALGFSLVGILNDEPRVHINLSPFFVAFFAFCFAVAMGAIWEIYEFTVDGLLQLNMQKYMLENGTALVGRAALMDTMEDLIVDAVGALTVTVLGYVLLRNRQRREKRKVHRGEEPSAQQTLPTA